MQTTTVSTLVLGLYSLVAFPAMAESVTSSQSDISLKTLTDTIYRNAPARQGEASRQQYSDAIQQRATTVFSDAATINFQHFNDAIGSGKGLQEWESSIAAPLWLPGQKRQQQNLSRHLAAELPYYQQRIRLEASALVRQHVWQVMQAAAQVRQAEVTVENAQALHKNVVQRVKAGDLAETEQLLAQSHLIEMQTQHEQAKAQLQQMINQYAYLTNQRKLPTHIEESLPADLIIDEQHPLLAEFGQKIATLRSEMDNAHYQNALNPTVSLGVKRERDDSGEPYNNSLGLGFSMPIGNNDVFRQPAIARASRAMAKIEIERQQLKIQLETQLMAQLDQLKSHQRQQSMLAEQYAITEMYLNRQQRSFEFGQIDLQTLLRVESRAQKNRQQIQLLEIAIQQKIAEINQTLGQTL